MCASLFDYLVKYDIGYHEVDLLGGLKAIVCRKVFLSQDTPTTDFIVILDPTTKQMQAIFTEMIGVNDALVSINSIVSNEDELKSFFKDILDAFPKINMPS